MPATWVVDIEVIDIPRRIIRMSATRTDGVDVRTWSAEGKYEQSQAMLDHYTNLFWNLYQADLTKEDQIGDLLGQAETLLSNALVAREP